MLCNRINVLTTLLGIHSIHETHMLLFSGGILVVKEAASKNRSHLPTIRTSLMSENGTVLYEEANELLERIRGNSLSVPTDLHILSSKSGQFKSTGVKYLKHLVHVETDKATQIRLIGDTDKTLSGILLHRGLLTDKHVITPCL